MCAGGLEPHAGGPGQTDFEVLSGVWPVSANFGHVERAKVGSEARLREVDLYRAGERCALFGRAFFTVTYSAQAGDEFDVPALG